MSFKLPPLPFEADALEPYLSKETLEFHYGKHHQSYVTKLNQALEQDPEFKSTDLETIIRKAEGSLFNNAAQVWNHTFYWNCLKADSEGEPGGSLKDAIKQQFGSFEHFRDVFTEAAKSLFGSGWTWLVQMEDGMLAVEQTKDAENPLLKDEKPLLACDVWEHAYYIDYRDARSKYVEAFWKIVNWEFVESQWQGLKKEMSQWKRN